MSSFAVIILCVWYVRLGHQNLWCKALRKLLQQRSCNVNSYRRIPFLLPCSLVKCKASWLPWSDFAALKMAKHWLCALIQASFSLIQLVSRWKKYPVPHKESAALQIYLLEPQGVFSTEWARCLRLCCFSFIAAFLLSASQTIAGSFGISFLHTESFLLILF